MTSAISDNLPTKNHTRKDNLILSANSMKPIFLQMMYTRDRLQFISQDWKYCLLLFTNTSEFLLNSATLELDQILRDIGVRTMRLMTNNPAKFTGLKGYGLAVIGRVPVLTPITEENKRYLETKRMKMGHIYGSDIREPLSGFVDSNTGEDDSTQAS